MNVSPENVVEVSEFLKANDLDHKFLSGSEPSAGKVFTVYLGSKEATERHVRRIYDGIGQSLEEQDITGQAMFAPKISGRFVGKKMDVMTKVAVDGVTIPRELGDPYVRFFRKKDLAEEDRKYIHDIGERARRKLLELYGDYFGGEITYYDPKSETA